MDSTQRFSDRAENYARYRPGYPPELIPFLNESMGIGPGQTVADVGSGTGLLSGLLLSHGYTVYAVEPNREMRLQAETWLGQRPGFFSREGTAEATGLEARSVDLVTAAQAFHWFDPPRTRLEFQRILTPGGHVALVWNRRRAERSPFMQAYENLVERYAIDYHRLCHRRVDTTDYVAFFGAGGFQRTVFPNDQVLDEAGLRGRLLSSSYIPMPGHPSHEPMLAELDRLFGQHQEGGRVVFFYETEIYWGRLD